MRKKQAEGMSDWVPPALSPFFLCVYQKRVLTHVVSVAREKQAGEKTK